MIVIPFTLTSPTIGTTYNANTGVCESSSGIFELLITAMYAWFACVFVVAVVLGFTYCFVSLHEHQVAVELTARRRQSPGWEAEIERELQSVKWLARIADESCLLGLDPIIGLVPVVGDIITFYPS